MHPGRLTWNLQITHLERKIIFQTSMIMFHVNLRGYMKFLLGELIDGTISFPSLACFFVMPLNDSMDENSPTSKNRYSRSGNMFCLKYMNTHMIAC